jgi:hypothetical protein
MTVLYGAFTMKRTLTVAVVLGGCFASLALGQECPGVSKHYQALKYPPSSTRGTWAVLDFDGAHRKVAPYLSSLGGGEFGTGRNVSPPFAVAVDKITFTVCGHDGQGGGREKNLVALVDARTGNTLQKTMAPGSDSMQERSWDVAQLRGRQVRIEVRDGIAAGGFAWIGVGRIDAGPSFRVDFREGLPDDWEIIARGAEDRMEVVTGGVPFRRRPNVYSLVPRQGTCEVPCGFRARRIFLLGCIAQRGKPLESYGDVEIVYRDGRSQRYPLVFGYTLDGELKLPSKSKAMYLHRSGDVFQQYLVLGPRAETIEKIVLRRNPKHDVLPRITAITCETQAASDNLAPLPDCRPDADEAAWIESHTITAESPDPKVIAAEIRRAHKM